MDEKQKPKNQFESEMTRMMETVILKLEGYEGRFDGLEKRFDHLEKEVSEIKSDVRIIKGQFSNVVSTVIEDGKRITRLEGEVAELQGNIH
jgi:archaellum component FlaC